MINTGTKNGAPALAHERRGHRSGNYSVILLQLDTQVLCHFIPYAN